MLRLDRPDGHGFRAALIPLGVLLIAFGSSAAAQTHPLAPVFGAALRGDMTTALRILDSLDTHTLDPKDSATAACIRSRFAEPPQAEDLPPVSQSILTAYRRYWQTAMLHRATPAEAEAGLLRALNTIFAERHLSDTAFTSLDDASEAARKAIEHEGLFALAGVTSPFYELMIWRSQVPRSYHVPLPEEAVDVHVVFLDQFVSLGWAGYATCDRAHTGGWATKDSLFAVRSAYDTTSEQFHVSYLGHEGRHFADYGLYPQLEQPELEYRAKLTEIALSDQTTHDLILRFASRIGKDRGVPHQFANYCLVRDLSQRIFRADKPVTDPDRWGRTSARRLRHEAERLLRQNDYALSRSGPATVRQFLAI